MKTPEQLNKQEDEVLNLPDNRENLRSEVEILKETADRFRDLDDEALIQLNKKDALGYNEKLRERARLFVDLPNKLTGALEGVDRTTKQRILDHVSSFAYIAGEALESGGAFALSVLLTHKGDKTGDKNDLEKFIEQLESK